MTATDPMATARVRELLRLRYGDEGWVFLEEVGDSTGGAHGRSLDGLAFGLWPSRGYEIHGIEIKVSRGDWLRELKQPGKADPFFVYCDFWWIAVPSAEIVKQEELPPGWGLLVANGEKVRTKVKGGRLQPQPLPRHFVAAMLQRGAQVKLNERLRIMDEASRAGEERARSQAQSTAAKVDTRYDDLRKKVDAFEAAAGLCISALTPAQLYKQPGELGAAVQRLLKAEDAIRSAGSRAANLLRQAGFAYEDIKRALQEVQSLAAREESGQ